MSEKKSQNKTSEDPSHLRENILDQRDLAVLWAIGILVSLLLSFAGSTWNPDRYEALQSEALDATEARVENSQNNIVAEALNDGTIPYEDDMAKLVKSRPALIIMVTDLARLLLFPSGPLIIIGTLIRKTARFLKSKKTDQRL